LEFGNNIVESASFDIAVISIYLILFHFIKLKESPWYGQQLPSECFTNFGLIGTFSSIAYHFHPKFQLFGK
jgi:hypothetical protein